MHVVINDFIVFLYSLDSNTFEKNVDVYSTYGGVSMLLVEIHQGIIIREIYLKPQIEGKT